MFLSAILCTYNRASLLPRVLAGLQRQTLAREHFELIVVDDGSDDATGEVVHQHADGLPLRYIRQEHAGLAAAKNRGIEAARGHIVLFLDDDDVADSDLLRQHLRTHVRYPERRFAVLAYTGLAPDVARRPLMDFVTGAGGQLFCYPRIEDGAELDFTYFWGGRSSCKRAFLIEHGVFDPRFAFGCEDIELGWRLHSHGLRVIYNRQAVSTMIRSIDFDGFCERLRRQGRSQWLFSCLHPNAQIRDYCQIPEYNRDWPIYSKAYDGLLRCARELDRLANARQAQGIDVDQATTRLLHQAYGRAFKACRLRGIDDARTHALESVPTTRQIAVS
jgi:glycosyltransferase involved in cell wall biosynthesis